MFWPRPLARVVVLLALAALVVVPGAGSAGAGSTAKGDSVKGFLTGPSSEDALELALGYVRGDAQQLGVTGADLGDLVVTDRYVSRHTGVTHVYLRQRLHGIDVFGGVANVNVAKDGSIVNVGNRLVPDLAASATSRAPGESAASAVAGAAEGLGLSGFVSPETISVKGGVARETVLDGAGISSRPIPAKLVYQPMPDGSLRLAWQLEIDELGREHYWNARVDAQTGELLAKTDYVSHADDSYNVFALPKENPNDGRRARSTRPGRPRRRRRSAGTTPTASPAPSSRSRAATTSTRTPISTRTTSPTWAASSRRRRRASTFDFPLDLTQEPATYRPPRSRTSSTGTTSSTTSSTGYGFNEAAGNFQVNNYGRGGTGNDDVRAEAQDGSGINNANFCTPADGQRPRMQMFIWTRAGQRSHVNAPPAIAGQKTATSAGFGPAFPVEGITVRRRDRSSIPTAPRRRARATAASPFATGCGRREDRARRPRHVQLQRQGGQRAERRCHRGDRRQQRGSATRSRWGRRQAAWSPSPR